jgi:hypothetical protein
MSLEIVQTVRGLIKTALMAKWLSKMSLEFRERYVNKTLGVNVVYNKTGGNKKTVFLAHHALLSSVQPKADHQAIHHPGRLHVHVLNDVLDTVINNMYIQVPARWLPAQTT